MSKDKSKTTLYYKFARIVARLICPKATTVFEDDIADEPAVFVVNHSNVTGPIMMTLDFPRKHSTWAISFALDRDKCVDYAFHDIFFGRSRKVKWFWRMMARIMSRLLPPILKYSDTIAVYHDKRIISTFKESIAALVGGRDLVIFAESPRRYSEYVNEMQTGFVDVARFYRKETGKMLKFYPVYVERKNRTVSVARPITYDPDVPMSVQREAICGFLRDGIDRMGRSLPDHKPTPFLPERWYGAYGEYEFDAEGYMRLLGGEDKKDAENEKQDKKEPL